jgi:hypothetical protein
MNHWDRQVFIHFSEQINKIRQNAAHRSDRAFRDIIHQILTQNFDIYFIVENVRRLPEEKIQS